MLDEKQRPADYAGVVTEQEPSDRGYRRDAQQKPVSPAVASRMKPCMDCSPLIPASRAWLTWHRLRVRVTPFPL